MKPDWIAVDWGTSSLRVWAMSGSGGILEKLESDDGMSGLEPAGFEPVLLKMIKPWLEEASESVPVFACGMVGSKQGWVEVPYESLPWKPGISGKDPVISRDRFTLYICHGLMQADPADVMRGEETQLAGLLAKTPNFEGTVCLPGTHSKWAEVSGGQVRSFRTLMTGELYALLAKQSVLKHSVDREKWNDDAFLEAIEVGLKNPGEAFAKLFSIRAESIFQQLDGGVARSRLSGLLAGIELQATERFWKGKDVALIGAGEISEKYALALKVHGATPRVYDVEEMTLAGLALARAAVAPGI